MAISKPMKLRLGLGAGFAALAIGAALAETAASPLPAAVQKLLDCRGTSADAARLACYDGAVAELGKLIASGEIVVVDHERVAKVKRQAFGFSLPSLSLFERGGPDGKPVELEQITATVRQAAQTADGKWTVVLDDGSVWRQIDLEKLSKYPKNGSKADVRKASMGSYFMNLDGQRALRVERVK